MNVFVNTKNFPDDPEALALKQFAEHSLQDALPRLEEIELQTLRRLRNEEI